MLTLHLKKHAPAPMNYLEKEEMKALLAAPDQHDRQGFRDYVLLLLLYNTGARASEASRLTVGDLTSCRRRQPFTGRDGKTASVLSGN